MVATLGKPAGLVELQLTTIDSDGIALGQLDPDVTPTADTTSHAYTLTGVTDANLAVSDPTVVEFFDGDNDDGYMSFGGGLLQAFDVLADRVHPALASILSGSLVDSTTNSEFPSWSANSGQVDYPTMAAIITRRYQSAESGSDGQDIFQHIILNKCEVKVMNDFSISRQEKSQFRLRITPAKSSTNLLGIAFGSNQQYASNRTDHQVVTTTKRLGLTTYISDGTTTTFTPQYVPVSDVVTLGATKNWLAINGTATAASSVNTTSGVVTLAAAGTSGDRNAFLYQHDGVTT